MNPLIRIALVTAALAGACLVARSVWPALAGNLIALRSWTRTEGEVRALNGAAEFEIGAEPDSYRALAAVDHTWGLRLFHRVPLFVDPADATRVKPAGLLQMWLAPAGMACFILLFLAAAWFGARIGHGQESLPNLAGRPESRWMFTPSPGPLQGGIVLHSPPRQWKIVVGWSTLGVAMAVISLLAKGGNPVTRIGYITLGSAFALALWAFAWHTRSLEITANDRGVRMTSALGWRDLPWPLVGSVEDQHIFTTYYNGRMRMWEMPFPGSTVRVLTFNDASDHTLMSFSPELEPRDSLRSLFDLCTERTGLKLRGRTIAIHY